MIDMFDKYLLMGQKLETVSLFECLPKQSRLLLSTSIAKNCLNKEIIDIKMFESRDSLKLMVLAKGISINY